MPEYNPADWYWLVGGDASRYWSSAASAYVQTAPSGAGVTHIAGEVELRDVLAAYGLAGPLVTADDVIAERDRRLALGFNYDFGDERGVHHIATTDEDMRGWDEVSKLASAAISAGIPNTPITILTSTGPATVTATEWQQVLLASAAHRQPIWQASFVLQAMNPIPADYADDAYWA